jgi:predicted Fe-Mo cluster-binding NifX family protein
MKIAVVTDDEQTVSQHFGRAEYYLVFTVAGNKITSRERRDKMGHRHFASSESEHGGGGGPHGYDAASQQKHASMASAISDCQVLIAGGMGMGAYESMKSYNIKPIVTDVGDIQQAVKLYIEGKLPNLMGRLH